MVMVAMVYLLACAIAPHFFGSCNVVVFCGASAWECVNIQGVFVHDGRRQELD